MDLQLLQKELNLSPYIQYNICHHLIPGLTQLSTLSAVVDGGKASLSAVVLFRHVAVLIKFCVGSRCWRTVIVKAALD